MAQQPIPNPAAMSTAFQQNSQALATVATEMSNMFIAQNNVANEVARFLQHPVFNARQIQHRLANIQAGSGLGKIIHSQWPIVINANLFIETITTVLASELQSHTAKSSTLSTS